MSIPFIISLYCGLSILPSGLLAVGYDGAPRSSAMSELFRPSFRAGKAADVGEYN